MMIHFATASFLLMSTSLLTAAADPPEINTNHATFADALTSNLYTNDNECSSALGVSMAFGLIYPSGTGNSADQIRNVFGYPSGSQLQLVWNDTASKLDSAYEGQCRYSFFVDTQECESELPTLEIANSIWTDDGAELNPTYADVVGHAVRQIDFDDVGAAGVINEWVANSTNGLIPTILPEGRLSAILIAVNSIYLKASWAKAFEEAFTNEDIFYTAPSRETLAESTAHFMHTVDRFRYSHNVLPGFQILQLPFIGNTLSLMIILPVSDTSGTVMSTQVLAALPSLEYTRVALALPKFKFESEYKDGLKSSLESLGLTAPFQGGLCIFEGDCSASVDTIIHKTIIDVNEQGVEAAAVTTLIMTTSAPPTDPPILFMADHPFQFFIYDSNEDLVIFEGRVGAPAIPEESPGAQLKSKHTDSDFWSSTFWM